MGWLMQSWSVGRLAGISVQIHATLLVFLAWTLLFSGSGWWWLDLAVAFGLFGSVLVHELGHALMGRAFGVGTRRIVLTPIGGVAELNSIPKSPRAEFWIALAGPLVSLSLAVVFWVLSPLSAAFVLLFWINLMLGLFNLVPVFPSDGGRIFRAMMSRRFGFRPGTQIAVKVGQSLAVLLGIWGLYRGQWTLPVIAVFLYWAAGAELSRLSLALPSWSEIWDFVRAEHQDRRASQAPLEDERELLEPDAVFLRYPKK